MQNLFQSTLLSSFFDFEFETFLRNDFPRTSNVHGNFMLIAIDCIAVSDPEPLLPTRKTGGLMRVGHCV